MKLCGICNTENPLEAVFCAHCGTRLQAEVEANVCPICEKINPVDACFCSGCGSSLEEEKENKMLCTSCNTENKAGSVFCRGCGNRLGEMAAQPVSTPAICSICGREDTDGNGYCEGCGAIIISPPAAITPQPLFQSSPQQIPQQQYAPVPPVEVQTPAQSSPFPLGKVAAVWGLILVAYVFMCMLI